MKSKRLKRPQEICLVYKKKGQGQRKKKSKGRGLESLISSDCFLCRSQLFPYNGQAVQSLGAIPRSSLCYCCSPPSWKIPVLFYVYKAELVWDFFLLLFGWLGLKFGKLTTASCGYRRFGTRYPPELIFSFTLLLISTAFKVFQAQYLSGLCYVEDESQIQI